MLDGVEYLHNQAKVVHRDLKPENLLITHENRLKFADFGLSENFNCTNGSELLYTHVGTRRYQAPEVLERKGYRGDHVDIFSLGVILFMMVSGAMPYLTEASSTDPLYLLIMRKCSKEYW